MLWISHPVIRVQDGQSRVSADVVEDGRPHTLWFEVAEKFADGLCADRADAFCLGLLHYAMKNGHDITCEAGITDQLHHQLTTQLIRVLARYNPRSDGHGIHPVEISAPLLPPGSRHKSAVGAGLSCGVDSLHVFAKYSSAPWPDKTITHACLYKLYGFGTKHSTQDRNFWFEGMHQRAKAFCLDNDLELLVGNTNFDGDCMDGLGFNASYTFANLFCVYAMQNLFSCYHIASSYAITDFGIRGHASEDCGHFDVLTTSAASIKTLAVYLDGIADNRLDKVRDIAAYPPARKYLNVCWLMRPDHSNCSNSCPKCMRTMLELYCCGVLEQFADVFDVNYFKRNFHEYLAEWYRGLLHGTPFSTEMRGFMPTRRISLLTRIKAWRIVARKMIMKLVRLGRTGGNFTPH